MHYKDNSRRFFWARIGVLVFWAGSLLYLVDFVILLFATLVLDGSASMDHGGFYETPINWITAVCRTIGGVLFILWMRRAYYNLGALGATTEFSDGWAVGAWLIPILNLVRPYQIIWDLIRKSEQMLTEDEVQEAIKQREGEDFHFQRFSNEVLGTWWLYCIAILLFEIIIRAFNDSKFVENNIFGGLMMLFLKCYYVLIVSASAVISLRIMKHQHRIAQLLITANESREA